MAILWKNLLVIIGLLGVSSCGIYRQNVVNVPLIQQKGQAQLSGHTSFSGLDGQASYALTKQIALMANYSNLGSKKEDYSSFNYALDKHYFGEAGIGYFKKTSKGNLVDFFLLTGQGKTTHFVQGLDAAGQITNYYKQAFYNRYCLQTDFGKSIEKLEYAFTPRLMVINYFNVSDPKNNTFEDLPNTYLYSDISFTLRYRLLKIFKISGQLNTTIPITGGDASYYEFSLFNGSIGMILNLNFCKQSVTNSSE